MGDYVRDPRHRFSYELRPDPELDAAIRALAAELEHVGALPPGAATAPRFQPHLTLLRADHVDESALTALAASIAHAPTVTFHASDAFGSGRVRHLPVTDRAELDRTRTSLLERLGAEHVDPLAIERPWTPHVTVAYELFEPHRDHAAAIIEAALPLTGRWRVAQAWDLDVRPTVLVAERPCIASAPAG